MGREGVEEWAGGARVAIAPEVVGAEGVDDNDQDVGEWLLGAGEHHGVDPDCVATRNVLVDCIGRNPNKFRGELDLNLTFGRGDVEVDR